ncbi:hypothetical protein OESDEN_02873 [Oesophagostomum dentatum]|uniref:ABC transporter domain-containing protein n=1 Tax=Oesophagostomum dentatum TaxID=61180 RepID=A0A0B1TM64_OESDE|nr:hypothetical protein OESDEN_02873 [Oesophagostomum dentatum]
MPKAGKLSGGEKRKLCLAMAFIGGSELIMLDEPTAGMDPQSRVFVKKLVEEKKNPGKRSSSKSSTSQDLAVILTTHYLDEAEAMGDYVYIMYMGHSLCSGTTHFLKTKFAPGIILNVVFSQNASREAVEATNKPTREKLIRPCQADP